VKKLLKLSLEDPKTFIGILDAISTVVDEAVFTANEEALTLRSLDSARSAMVDVRLPKQFFTEYEATGQTNIGIRIKDLIKIAKLGKRGVTQFQLEVPEGTNILKLIFIGKASTRTFELPLLDLTFEQIPVPGSLNIQRSCRI
jgi:proliferating cell nuclear antigen